MGEERMNGRAKKKILRILATLAVSSGFPVSVLSIAQQPSPSSTKTLSGKAEDPVLDSAAQWLGRALYARCLCTVSTFNLDAKGTLSPSSKTRPVDWTLAGVQLDHVERKGDQLEFSGVRVAARFAEDRHEFDRKPLKLETLKVIFPAPSQAAEVDHLLSAAFSNGIDRQLQLSLPPYWKHYFIPSEPWPDEAAMDQIPLVEAGSKVQGMVVPPPAVTHKSSFSYTEEAARDRVHGDVVLQLSTDLAGSPHRVRIAQPLGYGLDAVAVQSVQKTQFAPTAIAGKAVGVQFYLRDGFTLERPF